MDVFGIKMANLTEKMDQLPFILVDIKHGIKMANPRLITVINYVVHKSFSYWTRDEANHRDDGPASIYADGEKQWWNNGRLHRENGPALIGPSGYIAWYQDDKLHRVGGPAVEHPDGTEEWWENGKHIKIRFPIRCP